MIGPKGFLLPVWCVFTGCATGGDVVDDDVPKDLNGVDAGRAGRFDGINEPCPNAEPNEGEAEITGAVAGVGFWGVCPPAPP